MSQIPQLDIRRFATERDPFIQEFGEAYEEWGFAGITGHEVDATLIQSAMTAAKAFFDLPIEQKLAYEGDTGYERGYVPFGVEKAKDAKHVDLKEFFHVGREVDEAMHLGENVWPNEIANFKAIFETLFTRLDTLAHTMLEVFALHLNLDQHYFVPRVAHGEALLRILHYPPILDEDIPNVRAAAHEDINLLTLLIGSEQAGLEVLSRAGRWIPISMIEGTIVCNVGDMLQRLSNKRLPSTTHRVVNPQGELARTSRYSMPFFMHPSPDVSLAVLPQCVDAEHPMAYPPISAGEFLQQRLNEIGLVKN